VLDRRDVSVCLTDPGFDLDVLVTADTVSLHRVWIGRASLASALRDESITVDGQPDLERAFPSWFALSPYAHIASAEQAPSPT
jgi:hypothetical protein